MPAAYPTNAAAYPTNGGAYVGWGRIIGMNGVQQGDSLGVLRGSGWPAFRLQLLRAAGGHGFLPPGSPRWLA